jgi:hypothetical protein
MAEQPAVTLSSGDWQQRDLVPRPDPTLLTNAAIEQVTVQYRRELGQLERLLAQRMDSMDQTRLTYLEVLNARHEALATQLADLARLLDERYATQTKALDAAFVAAEKAVATALDSAEKAVTKAETATEIRFQGVNEFRQALTDQANNFLPRAQYDAAHIALVEVTSELRSRLDALTGQIVSREENLAWRDTLQDKIGTVNERIAALELRLTSRLDVTSGTEAGQAGQRGESRLNVNTAITAGLLVISLVTFIVLYLVKK